jgi:hypothetical protein
MGVLSVQLLDYILVHGSPASAGTPGPSACLQQRVLPCGLTRVPGQPDLDPKPPSQCAIRFHTLFGTVASLSSSGFMLSLLP